MPFPVEAYQSDIGQIVGDVFSTMLKLDIESVPDAWSPSSASVTACIFFAGNWKGAVLVECNEFQARQWTARLTSLPDPGAMTDDVRDAMGEVVNMVGGNLKSVLPRGIGLSMPSVVQGKDYSMRICGGNLINRQCFETTFGKFWITFVEVLEA
jgi:chemotaxis protein CheX